MVRRGGAQIDAQAGKIFDTRAHCRVEATYARVEQNCRRATADFSASSTRPLRDIPSAMSTRPIWSA
jgi:hypothetical protein